MDYLLAPTLFQNKTCRLPGIGSFELVIQNAETYFSLHEIIAPVPFIIFEPAKTDENIFNEFTALSEIIKKDLLSKRRVTLKGIGDFVLNTQEDIEFLPLKVNEFFIQPVIAERVLRQDIEHTLLVGDKEITNTAMVNFFDEETNATSKFKWWMAAIFLAIIGVVILVIYLSLYGLNSFGSVF